MKRKIFISIILAILFFIAILYFVFNILPCYGGCVIFPELEFSQEVYEGSLSPYLPPESGILNQTWNGSTLTIEAFVKTYCGGATITGSFEQENDNLILLYDVKTNSAITECRSVHKLIYKISDLPYENYNISIKGI